tara:strand:- start:137 stop:337 length:201 start_codon:yes stop_codon:yes gene_type:complete
MKFNLTCDLDNAAFDDCSGLELSRILGSVINKLEYISELTTDDHGKVKDMNGNTVCKWEILEEEDS